MRCSPRSRTASGTTCGAASSTRPRIYWRGVKRSSSRGYALTQPRLGAADNAAMTNTTFASLLLTATMSSLASAGPVRGEQHTPALFLDEPQTTVFLQSRDKGYQFEVATRIVGTKSNHDRARVDWKQGGKVVGTAACKLEWLEDAAQSLAVCISS